MDVYPSPYRWTERPLLCLIGRHKWTPHPSATIGHRGMFCQRCATERWTHLDTP